MIKLYHKTAGSSSYRRAKAFLKKNCIPFEECSLSALTKTEFLHLLKLSDTGFDSFIISRREENKKRLELLYQLSMGELIDYCIANPKVLKEPIIADTKQVVVGYRADDIRCFIPREVRTMELK